jgi:uncharacterized protein (DUF433 family)
VQPAYADQRETPLYSVEEAAGYLRIPISTLRAWTLGRRKASGDGGYDAVLKFVSQTYHRLSFYDLVEAHILRAAVEKHVPLRHIKRGLVYLRSQSPTNARPLLSYNFKTDGKYLLVGGMLGSKDRDLRALVNASQYGQLEMRPLLPQELSLLEGFDEYFNLVRRDKNKMPDTLFPKDGHKLVSITSGVFSGRPVVEGTRIPTAVIAQRFKAGEGVNALAKDYHLSKEKIEAAIQYEEAA